MPKEKDVDVEVRLEEVAAKLTPEFMFNSLKIKFMQKIKAGEVVGGARELEQLIQLEKKLFDLSDKEALEEIEKAHIEFGLGIPDRNKVKRSYTMSPAKLEANRQNAQQSTGPRTAEGKKKSAANGANANWKHGHCSKSFIKKVMGVCTKKCDKYPCSAVEDEETCAGELCLDREGYLKKVNLLVKAAQDGDIKDVKEFNAVLLANQQEILERMQMAIIEDGTVILEDMVNKDGIVVAQKFKNHPHIGPALDYMFKLGITFPTMRMTPQELQKTKDVQDAGQMLATAFSGASKALAKAEELRDDDASS